MHCPTAGSVLLVGGVHLLELLQADGVLTLGAGGVEADVVERFVVGRVGGENAGLDCGGALETPLKVDELGGERGFDGAESIIVLDHGRGEGLVCGFVFAGQEDVFAVRPCLYGLVILQIVHAFKTTVFATFNLPVKCSDWPPETPATTLAASAQRLMN